MNIKKIDLFFNPNSTNKNIFVEIVEILSFQKKNIMIILNSVKLIKQ